MGYTFKPNIWMTLATLVIMTLCIKLGFWQYNKAEAKQALQQQLEKGMLLPPVGLPQKIADVEFWRYRRVKFSGTYEPKYQVFLDNQVENTVAGYHVLTPVKLESNGEYVLVNRGWIAGSPDRKVPAIQTPVEKQEIVGDVYIPPEKFYSLETPQLKEGKWQLVWQNLDMKRYAKALPSELQPFVVRLDAQNKAGGFSRNWLHPGERVDMHLGYAYQWFGFALTLLVIYLVLNIKKVK